MSTFKKKYKKFKERDLLENKSSRKNLKNYVQLGEV